MPDDQLTLDEQLKGGIAKIGSADLVVGIPSFRNAATIGYVASTAAKGLREHFPGARVAIVNADGGSEDGTPDRVVEGASGVPVIRNVPRTFSSGRAASTRPRATQK